MINLNRSDKQYTNIEKFKKYELTYCIAYEMAIRNDEVINSVKSFVNNYIDYDRFLKEAIYDSDLFKKCDDDSQKLMNFFLNPFNLYLDYHFFDDINQKIKTIEIEEQKGLNKVFNPIRRILYKKLDNYYDISEYNNIFSEHKQTSLYISTIAHKKKKKKGTRKVTRNDIEPNYSRPLSPSFKEIKERRFILNLALPTAELLSFVEEFKNMYDKDNTIVKNVYELFENKKNKNINLPNIQNNYADMFFIYDCRKLGYTQAKIQSKIDRYYEDLDTNNPTIQLKTISKYHKISIEYIDNKKYKYLVT